MSTYKIHPIVMGTKIFDKEMMTYQYEYGVPYTIPIYCMNRNLRLRPSAEAAVWLLEGGQLHVESFFVSEVLCD